MNLYHAVVPKGVASYGDRNIRNATLFVLLSCVGSSFASSIDEVIVTSDFRPLTVQSAGFSVSVIDQAVIHQRNAQHVEELLALAPNVNYAAGASRGRYFQIRGIGERSQFVAPLNPSVGTFVDGVDFTGFGGAATLLDVAQVEVLRGSQGTRFGANALAGVISLKSVDATNQQAGYIKSHVTSYGGRGFEGAHGGAVSEHVAYRVAMSQTRSDGYIDNVALKQDNTNHIDEFTGRAKIHWAVADNLTVDLSALYVDVDNGYDAFSLDQNRTTMSDEPGHDRQISRATTLLADWGAARRFNVQGRVNVSRTDADYGYDEDWTYAEFQPDYQAFDNYLRNVSRESIELRWLSNEEGRIANSDWLLGLYYQNSQVDLLREYTYASVFNSQYDTASRALFTHITTALGDNLRLTSGLRIEHWASDYADSKNLAGDNDENLFGGKLAIEYTASKNALWYASITRGYKAGGFNGGDDLPSESLRNFDTEFQINYELGGKFIALSGSLRNRISAFYTDRKDLQLKSSSVIYSAAGNPSWIDYTDNAGAGISYGLEWELQLQFTESLNILGSFGWLETEITEHNQLRPAAFNLMGREGAHAPEYTYAVSAQYKPAERLNAQLEFEGRDAFFYSDSHNYRASDTHRINLRLRYQTGAYEVQVYANNVTDEDYGVRGFSGWDADPRSGDGFDEQSYQQLGAPRVLGLTVRLDF